MSDTKIIDGKAFALELRERIASQVKGLRQHGVPGLAVILVGDDPASQVYVRNKNKAVEAAGMNSVEIKFPADVGQHKLLFKIDELNEDPNVHGILVQLPLPDHINEHDVIQRIDPLKDVDGFHVENVGKFATGQDALIPCTPKGCLMLIKDVLGNELGGKEAIVIGRSNIVGKPMARLLLAEHATVIQAHSRTKDLPEVCKRADIVVAAVGKPGMVKADWIKPGATVIDVGINRTEDGKLVGDVDFDSVKEVAGAITPVPGGVGPMTIACLLDNTLLAFCAIKGITVPEVGNGHGLSP